jgi:hypothetical protein
LSWLEEPGEAVPMLALVRLIFSLIADSFRPRAVLEAEVLVLRQQIIVLRRGRPSRSTFSAADKLVFGWLCQLFPRALTFVRPETVVRWHRAGFRSYWVWKSSRAGRPILPACTENLVRS